MSQEKAKLLDSKGIITEEALRQLDQASSDVSCECPAHLIEIYRSVQAFSEYQKNCISQKPQDELIHQWLKTTSLNLEHLLSNTIITLARFEGMIDEDDQVRSND